MKLPLSDELKELLPTIDTPIKQFIVEIYKRHTYEILGSSLVYEKRNFGHENHPVGRYMDFLIAMIIPTGDNFIYQLDVVAIRLPAKTKPAFYNPISEGKINEEESKESLMSLLDLYPCSSPTIYVAPNLKWLEEYLMNETKFVLSDWRSSEIYGLDGPTFTLKDALEELYEEL